MFIPGSRVTFECNEGFMLIGDQRRVCTNEGRWDVPVYGYTQCLRKYSYNAFSMHLIIFYNGSSQKIFFTRLCWIELFF